VCAGVFEIHKIQKSEMLKKAVKKKHIKNNKNKQKKPLHQRLGRKAGATVQRSLPRSCVVIHSFAQSLVSLFSSSSSSSSSSFLL
jgi:hypothetical protein